MLKDNSSFNIINYNKLRGLQSVSCYNDPIKRKICLEKDLSLYLKNMEFILSNSSCKPLYNSSKIFKTMNKFVFIDLRGKRILFFPIVR